MPAAADSAPPAAPERAKLARTRVSVFFLGAAGTLPLGVAMLFAAIAGALLVALIGSARILQLRHTARRR